MARNYRQMVEHHKEDLSGAGDFNSIAKITKDSDKFQGTAGYVLVHYLVEDRSPEGSSDAPNLLSNMGFGTLFAASHSPSRETVDGESGLLDPDDIIELRAKNGLAGTVRLSLDTVIKANQDDVAEKDGTIYLWCKTPDSTADDHIIMRYYFELYGRWVNIAGL